MKMKNLILIAVFMASCFIACTEKTPSQTALVQNTEKAMAPSKEDLVKRGEYLVETMGCHDCHSPKIMGPQGPSPDPNLLLSGHPANVPTPKIDKKANPDWVLFSMDNTITVGPWGISYAANLTPDDTGIGSWTLENFGKAVREGKYKGMDGSRMLLPPMPWPNYRNLKDDDLNAIFTYLKSLKPVKNIVPAPKAPNEI